MALSGKTKGALSTFQGCKYSIHPSIPNLITRPFHYFSSPKYSLAVKDWKLYVPSGRKPGPGGREMKKISHLSQKDLNFVPFSSTNPVSKIQNQISLFSSLSVSTSNHPSHLLTFPVHSLVFCNNICFLRKNVIFSALMHGVWRNQLKARIPVVKFGGKCFKDCSFRGFGSVFAAILILGSVVCGVCEEVSVGSVPLGFEVSGFDRQRRWVSENGVFGFGFLDDYLNNDDGLVVGVSYNLGSKAANVPVWVVGGGGVRVSENSTIRLSLNGSLILFDNLSGSVCWSSDTSNLGVQNAKLLNNGNLVLMGVGDKVVWESFSSPTDTLLPGQSLWFPRSLRAPSTKSTLSYYSLVIRRSGELALVWENNVTYWSSGLSSTIVAKEARFQANGVFGLIDASGRMVWSKSCGDSGDTSVALRHLRIDLDGNLRMYSWSSSSWKIGWQAVESQCHVFGSCGLYSVCGYNSTGPVCDCLVEDSTNLGAGPPGAAIESFGCKKMVDLGNCKTGTSISTLKHTVLYGLYPPHDFNIMLNQEACKDYCSNDTSCIAATTMNDGSGLCTIKRTSYISGFRDASVAAVSFLKVCLVPQAASTRQTNSQINGVSKPLPAQQNISEQNWKSFTLAIIVMVVLTALVFLTLEIGVFVLLRHTRKVKSQRRIPFGKDVGMDPPYSALVRLSYEEVKELTENFKHQLGPNVFRGVLPNQVLIIAKELDSVVASEREFRMVVSTLGGIHHRNLVSLKGFCFESNHHKILLYEYIDGVSLDKWLFNKKQGQNGVNWQKRLDIAHGVARALAYLHSECQQCIAHGNLNLENVLLDENLVAKVTGFGIQGLLEKETTSSSESLPERDIYMFGQMLLQILIGDRVVVSPQRLIKKLSEDKNSVDNAEWEQVERASRVALWCIQDRPFLRPSIGEVVKILEGALSVDKPPSSFDFKKETPKDEEDTSEIKVLKT